MMARQKGDTMAKLQRIDRAACRKIRSELEGWLETFGEEMGIIVEVGNARFTPESVTFKLNARIADEDGLKSMAQLEFEAHAEQFGLKTDDYERKFKRCGKLITIVGIKPRSYKYPILGRTSTGKVYKYPANTVVATIQR